MLVSLNLGLRFVLELAGVGAFWWSGNHLAGPPLGYLLGTLAAAAMILVWARYLAPRAIHPQTPRFRLVVGTAVLELSALALGVAGVPELAIPLAILVAANAVGLAASGEGTAA